MQGSTPSSTAELARLSELIDAIYQGPTEGTFAPLERDRLAILLPHLSCSLGVMTRLRNLELRATASLATLDRLSAGVLFDTRGRRVSLTSLRAAFWQRKMV